MSKKKRKETKIRSADIMARTTLYVNITNVRTLKIKLTIALWFIKLACWIAGCGIKIEDDIYRP